MQPIPLRDHVAHGGKVIEVDFAARRRVLHGPAPARVRMPLPAALPAHQALGRSSGFLMLATARDPHTAEYMGGRCVWGWMLFVWTSDPAVGPVWRDLLNIQGYVAQRLTRQGFVAFLRRASDVGGLLLDGDLDEDGRVIHAEPDQLIRRHEALSALCS